MSDWINDRGAPRPPRHRPEDWWVVVPVKGGPEAKSRLRAPDGVDRPTLARAFALDTVGAAAEAVGAAHVVVVTSDPDVVGQLQPLGTRVVADPAGGLDAAVRAGVAAVPPADPAAVLLGDVPTLRGSDLRAALRAGDVEDRWFVPDAEGSGTVLLGSHRARDVVPSFGAGSAARHEEAGYARLALDLDRLRRDVDDAPGLVAALGLGVGTHTAALLAHLADVADVAETGRSLG